jgi:hypothetical protein
MPLPRPLGILCGDVGIQEKLAKEVNPKVPNPLAISVTLGGLLLDVVTPRPKPRAGFAQESSLRSVRVVSRTPFDLAANEQYDGPLVPGG